MKVFDRSSSSNAHIHNVKSKCFNNESSIQQYSDSKCCAQILLVSNTWTLHTWGQTSRSPLKHQSHSSPCEICIFPAAFRGVQVVITVAEQSNKQSDVTAVEGHFPALQKRMRSVLSCLGLEGSQEWTRNNPVKLKHLHPPFHLDPHQNIVDESLVHSSLKFYVVIP